MTNAPSAVSYSTAISGQIGHGNQDTNQNVSAYSDESKAVMDCLCFERAHRIFERLLPRKADAFIACSDSTINTGSATSVSVLRNPTGCAPFRSPSNSAKSLSKIDLVTTRDPKQIKENGALISNMAETVDNLSLNTLADTANSIAMAGSGLEVIGALSRVQKLLSRASGPNPIDNSTLEIIKTELESERIALIPALQKAVKDRETLLEAASDGQTLSPQAQQQLMGYEALVSTLESELETLDQSVIAINKQLNALKTGHETEVRKHMIEAANDVGALIGLLATTLHHALNPFSLIVSTSTLALAATNSWESELARIKSESELQRLEKLIQQDTSPLRTLGESLREDKTHETAHHREERDHHAREVAGTAAVVSGTIAAIAGAFYLSIGFALLGASTLITNNVLARMRKKNISAPTQLSQATPVTQTNRPRLPSDTLQQLLQSEADHIARLADYLDASPNSVRIGLRHCGIQKTLRSFGSAMDLAAKDT